MASKKPIDDELGELFSGLGDDGSSKKPAKPKSAISKARTGDKADDDLLAELENLGDQPARPHTPRVKDVTKRSSTATPPPAAGRLSEDKPNVLRKSGESNRSYHASFTPSATSSESQENEKKGPVESTAPTSAPAPARDGGGWWGGLFATATATASAAIKQAESAYTHIQQNEDAKKYLDQVKGNVGYIKSYGEFTSNSLHPSLCSICFCFCLNSLWRCSCTRTQELCWIGYEVER
jgi:hypothetical protein